MLKKTHLGPVSVVFLLTLTLHATSAIAQSTDAFQSGNASNLNTADKFVNFANNGTAPLCLNTYVLTLTPQQQLVECCAMGPLVSGPAAYSRSIKNTLINNPFFPPTPSSVQIDFIASQPVSGNCNAGLPASSSDLVSGLTAAIDSMPGTGGVPFTQKAFNPCVPVSSPTTICTYTSGQCSAGCLALSTYCSLFTNGTGFGDCGGGAYSLVSSTSMAPASGQNGDHATLSATIGPMPTPSPFTIAGSLQFTVNNVNAGAPIVVTGPGTYTSDYVITQAPGMYPIVAAFTSTGSRVLGSSGANKLDVTCTTPPTITGVSASPASLWPANNKMVSVSVAYSVAAQCGTPTCALGVASNEPASAGGDWSVTGPHAVQLRASRDGNGSGRIYTVTVSCHDTFTNASTGTATVLVPHDQGH